MMQKLIGRLKEFDLGIRGKYKYFVFAVFLFAFFYTHVAFYTERLYWMHLLISYVIGFVLLFLGKENLRKTDFKNTIRGLFPKDIWCHPSTINDCILAVLNVAVNPVFIKIINLIPMVIFGVAGYKIAGLLPIEPYTMNPTFSTMLVLTVAMFIMADFSFYWSHRWTHKIAALWEFHKVHHSAEVMTPITLLRIHPVDNFLNSVIGAMGRSFIVGFFFYLYPTTSGVVTILSTNILVFIFHILGSNLRHSHIWWSWGPMFDHIFISPAMHHIHHSDKTKHLDKNFGSILSLWDWIFGTIYVPDGRENIVFGLGKNKETENYDTVMKLYFRPFYRAYKVLTKK